jgi:hypothetical protein
MQNLRSYELLRSIERLAISSISGQPISLTFKVQDIQKRTSTGVNLSLSFTLPVIKFFKDR